MKPIKLLRITTVPLSMRLLLAGQPGYMRSRGMDVVLVSSDGSDWAGIPDLASFEVHKIDMARAIDLKRDILALWALVRLFRKVKPDIVHSHTPKAGLLAMLAARLTGVRVRMHTVAGLPLMERTGWRRGILVAAEKLTYACASMVYPNSVRLREYIEREGFVRPDKLHVIAGGSSNGIDTDYFEPTGTLRGLGAEVRETYGIGHRDLVFVFIGRIVADKGIHELVDAFGFLASAHPGIHLLLVGPFEDDLDPIDPRTREAIRGHPRIHVTGFAADVRPYLCASDVLVFPSYREGFPNVPLQAGCFGLPGIVTDINGCNEIIIDGVNGLLVPPKDAVALGRAMERMSRDDAFRAACASVAREHIVRRYQQARVWDSLYEEYRRLLA
jgi:glycosyltransferase involved in cell wall biosynthesis